MAKDHMILAVNYDPNKYPADYFPAAVTEKYDGVAARFTYSAAFNVVLALSRQQEAIKSVEHITHWLLDKLPANRELIGELFVADTPFKDISGLARSFDQQPQLQLMVYDYVEYNDDGQPAPLSYEERMHACLKTLGPYMTQTDRPVWFMPTKIVNSHEEVSECMRSIKAHNPKAEGLVIRPTVHPDSIYKVGRSKAFIRWKPEPTVDLVITGIREAVSDNVGLGMAGRLIGLYKGKEIGIGPGKLTHVERRQLWLDRDTFSTTHPHYKQRIAEIKYMEDDSYEALRQPTFQRWRPDKTEPDA